MFSGVLRRLTIAGSALAMAALAVVVVAPAGADPVSASVAIGAGGEFHAVAPARVLDTRNGINDLVAPGAKALTPGGSTFTVQLLGQGGLPGSAAEVLGVVATVTVVGPTHAGSLKVWGDGGERREYSTVSFVAGSATPNLSILVPGADGRLSIELTAAGSAAGTAHVLVDVLGWISSSQHPVNGDRLVVAGPGRVYDSRDPRFGGNAFSPGQSVRVPIRGADSLSPAIADLVPDDPAISAVLVNITGINTFGNSADTFVSAVPFDPSNTGAPSTSNLNLRRGQIKANLALVQLGADGAITLYNSAGNVHLALDVVGYLRPGDPATRAGRIVPLDVPFRVIDTRQQRAGAPAGSLGPGMGEDWDFSATVADVRVGGQAVGPQVGFLGNLTGYGLQRPPRWYGAIDSFLTAYPTPSDPAAGVPEVSNLNLQNETVVDNLGVLRYGTGQRANQVRFYNYNGYLDYSVDAAAVILAD